MDIYGNDALGSRGSSRGPQRAGGDDYYAAPAPALAIVPAPKPAAQARQNAAPQSAPASAQPAQKRAANPVVQESMDVLKAAIRAAGQSVGPGTGTLPGQTPSTSPAQIPEQFPGQFSGQNGGTNPIPMGTPASVSQGNPIAGPRFGFALYPQDSWLARMQLHADNWIDLHPTARALVVQRAGCDPKNLNSVVGALNVWCSQRTGRPAALVGVPQYAPTSAPFVPGTTPGIDPASIRDSFAVPIQQTQWGDRYGYQPVVEPAGFVARPR